MMIVKGLMINLIFVAGGYEDIKWPLGRKSVKEIWRKLNLPFPDERRSPQTADDLRCGHSPLAAHLT
jgi:hypothetical protein